MAHFISGSSSPQWKLTRLFHAWFVLSCIICCPTWSALCSSPSPTLIRFTICTLNEWFSGRILTCLAGNRGLIPCSCIWLLAVNVRRAHFHNSRLVRLIWRGSGSKSYIGQQHNQSVSVPLNSAIRWHGWLISERRFLHRQFLWSATDEVMTQTWFFGGVLRWSSQWGGRDSMPMQNKDRATSVLVACLKYLFV